MLIVLRAGFVAAQRLRRASLDLGRLTLHVLAGEA
jgi:hypothetical protein